jgi:dTDP-4-amino-4,6-dideoxygalactose transaminase
MARIGIREIFAVSQVIAGGRVARYGNSKLGPTAKFERRMAEQMDVKHVLAVNSGTSALICALVGAGIGPGDEVLVPAYTWVATAIAPLAVGAVPVIVDIDESMTMDPVDLARKITPYSKAVIPVHMLNVVCNLDAIARVAAKHNLKIIEDACQAVGASYKGRRVGTFGHAGCFSFNQYKNMNTGEGGAVLTNDDRLFVRARNYHDAGSYTRDHEITENEPAFAGLNLKVSELTGALMQVQLSKLDRRLRCMRRHRRVMYEILSASSRFRVSPNNDPDNALSLTVLFDNAAEAAAFSKQRGVTRLIDTGRHVYTNWQPVMTQRAFDDRMNPYSWAKRKIEYSPDMCSRSLDLLSRTCSIATVSHGPLLFTRRRAQKLLAAA